MQATDIELGGAGYMVAPGSYRRGQDGAPEGRTGRVVVRDFFGGQRRALQLERDRSWDGLGVGPALGGQGVVPWPHGAAATDPYTDLTLGGAGVTPTTVRVPHALVGDRAYVAIANKLFRSVPLTAASWGDFGLVATVAGATRITRLAWHGGKVLMFCGGGASARTYDPGTGTVAAVSPTVNASIGASYAGQVVWADLNAAEEHILRATTGSSAPGPDKVSWALDSPIVHMGLHGGELAVATRTGLWLLGGRADPGKADDGAIAGDQSVAARWTADPRPFFTHGVWAADDDFLFLLSYGGRLYTWLNNVVMEWNPHAGTNRQGWRAVGPEGRSCHGATVAGNTLIVALTDRFDVSCLWAFDGAGWWQIHGASGQARVWPMHTGGAGNHDLVTFRDGSGSVTYDRARLVWRHAGAPNLAAAGLYRTSLLDAGERDKRKAWRKAGAVFASPEDLGNSLSSDPAVALTLEWSTGAGGAVGGEGGTVATGSVTSPERRTYELAGELAGFGGATPTGHTLQLTVSWSGVTDWAPVLVGLWAEYELLDAPARRRRWALKVHARDRAVGRDGAASPRTGRQLAADLWAAWRGGQTLPFKDLDHDVTGETARVRIVGIAEEVPKPADGGRWGESVLSLTLVEV